MPPTVSDCVAVTVPATTANIGPGFDCLGAALTLYNQFVFTRLTAADSAAPAGMQIHVSGPEAERVQLNQDNLAYRAYCYLFQQLDQTPPPVEMQVHLGVPLARGLGSSATAIVGGLVGANILAGSPLSQADVLKLAIALEGHPDNVAPALLGGCCLAASDSVQPDWAICHLTWHPEIVPVVAIPEFELSTQAARQVLPQTCSYGDAIFNTAHLGLLIKGLETGRPDWLRVALSDRLHQPYRQSLIEGYATVERAALAAGAHGLVISGAGPTLLALTHADQTDGVIAAIQTAWRSVNIAAQVTALRLDTQGAIATVNSDLAV